jgi:hypothetical protein
MTGYSFLCIKVRNPPPLNEAHGSLEQFNSWLPASPCGRLSRPPSTINPSDFRQVIRPSSLSQVIQIGKVFTRANTLQLDTFFFKMFVKGVEQLQYYHQHVTQPLLLEHLWDLGIAISEGQLSQLLTVDHEDFHREREALLGAGIEVSCYLQTDDTSARHEGKNGYCTCIGNELFAWFESTQSKSRVNFLELLRAGHGDYMINAGTLEYRQRQGLPKAKVALLESGGGRFADKAA